MSLSIFEVAMLIWEMGRCKFDLYGTFYYYGVIVCARTRLRSINSHWTYLSSKYRIKVLLKMANKYESINYH